MRSRRFLAAALAVQGLAAAGWTAQGATGAAVDVLAVRSIGGHRVSLVAAVHPAPLAQLDASAVRITSGGSSLPTSVTPVLTGRAAFAVVVDASSDGAGALQGGGLSGVAGFMLQLPPDAQTAVVADHQPPSVVAPPSVGVSDDLRAANAIRSGGARATADALDLAVDRLPAWPARQPVVVLFTSSSDAGAESSAALAERLQQAHAILAVVTTSPDVRYWTEVAQATGGLAVTTPAAQAIRAFDAVADDLRSRYVVTFTRPSTPAAQVEMRLDLGEPPSVVAVALPPEPGATRADTPGSSASGIPGVWIWVLGALVLGAVTLVFVVRRRHRSRQVAAGEGLLLPWWPFGDDQPSARRPAPPSPPPGVRVFDIPQSGTPHEITGSLFEPRAERDARQNGRELQPQEEPQSEREKQSGEERQSQPRDQRRG